MASKIRFYDLKNEMQGIYIDVHNNGFRSKKYTKLKVYKNPIGNKQKQHNSHAIAQAHKLITQEVPDAKIKGSHNFIEFSINLIKNDVFKGKRAKIATISKFQEFLKYKKYNQNVLFSSSITEILISDFIAYLANGHIAPATAIKYARQFKQIIKRTNQEKITNVNVHNLPSPSVKLDDKAIKKIILTKDDILKIYNVNSNNEKVKLAFIFSTQTGLDFSSTKSLKFDNISKDCQYLTFQRPKTNQSNKIKLSKLAQDIVKIQKAIQTNDFIFNLPSWTASVKALRKIAKIANINNHDSITWHTARHSFGSILINDLNINIRTVQDMLGHSDIKQTLRYTHINSKTKDSAIDILNDFIISND